VDTIPEAASADSAAAIPVVAERPVTGRRWGRLQPAASKLVSLIADS
jgi:hypothetical protein